MSTGRELTGEEVRLHKFRQEIDANIKVVEVLINRGPDADKVALGINDKAGRELALVRTKLQEAKMWAGKCLEAINSPFPEELRDEAK